MTLAEPMDVPMGEFTVNDVTGIEGAVTATEGDTLTLVARWLHPRGGRKYDALYASFAVPLSRIQLVESWRFAGRRSALTIGAIVVASVFVVDIASRAAGGGGILPIDGDSQSVMGPR